MKELRVQTGLIKQLIMKEITRASGTNWTNKTVNNERNN